MDFTIQMLSNCLKPEDSIYTSQIKFTRELGPKASSILSRNLVSNIALTISKNRITEMVKNIRKDYIYGL